MAKRISLVFSGFILLLLFFTGCGLQTETNEVTFVRVVDGDTLIADINGVEEYVRLLLVDTPETKHPNKDVQPFGPEASQIMEENFSTSEPIRLEYGTEKRDKYDRVLAYVYTKDDQMINEMLLVEGLARVAYIFPPNDKYVDRFRDLEADAKAQGIGIWSIDGYATDRGFNMDVIP